jgi:hypothetical protein
MSAKRDTSLPTSGTATIGSEHLELIGDRLDSGVHQLTMHFQ